MAVAQLAVVALFLFLWEYGTNRGIISAFFFSKPSAIWDYLGTWAKSSGNLGQTAATTLWQDLGATAFVFLAGYAIGMLLGIASGIVIGSVRIVREVAEPYIAFCNAVPRLILLPVLVVVFGFGYLPQILLVIIVIYFVVTVQIATGVQETPQNLLDNARILGASKLDLVRNIYVPSLTIWILSTSRGVVGYALQAAVAAEFLGAARGLGFRFQDAQTRFQSDEMFAAFAVVLLLALAVDVALALVEWRKTRWMSDRAMF